MKLFCKHLWFFEGCDKRHISHAGKITVREKWVCAKCGRIKHRRRVLCWKSQAHKASFFQNDAPRDSSEWKSVYDQKPIYKE